MNGNGAPHFRCYRTRFLNYFQPLSGPTLDQNVILSFDRRASLFVLPPLQILIINPPKIICLSHKFIFKLKYFSLLLLAHSSSRHLLFLLLLLPLFSFPFCHILLFLLLLLLLRQGQLRLEQQRRVVIWPDCGDWNLNGPTLVCHICF